MNRRVALLLVVFVPYCVFSIDVIVTRGFGGLFALVGREPWALQMFLDLLILYVAFSVWLWRDARERKIAAWPFIAMTLTLGSMGALAYLIRREIRRA